MSNPVRYMWNNEFFTQKPLIEKSNRKLWLSFINTEGDLNEEYPEASIDVYSAPDVIYNYPGSTETNRNEFLRVFRHAFKGLKIAEKGIIKEGEGWKITPINFSFREYKFEQWGIGSDEKLKNIPIGKFVGLTVEQIKAKQNKFFAGSGRGF